MTLYDFNVKDAKMQDVSLNDYKGKVLLIINTATGCGFTPQYEGLQNLYEKYKDRGFEILDFPCNQFLNQAPGSNQEIQDFCRLKYHTTFQTFAKIDVNGKNADPLFNHLKDYTQGFFGKSIKWNFTKFLVDRNGKTVKRFAPTDTPEKMEEEIVKYIG